MIKYSDQNKQFELLTYNTKYIFHVVDGKFLQHDFYGDINAPKEEFYKARYHSFSPYHDSTEFTGGCPNFSLNEDLLEFSYFDSGDFRCSSLRIKGANGDSSTFFAYRGYEILDKKPAIRGIPSARACDGSETLVIYLHDDVTDCDLALYYTLYPEFDVITRYFTLKNRSDVNVKIEKAMSLCLDLPGHDFDLISLHGHHNMERQYQRNSVFYGSSRIMSRRGASSHQLNPFIALVDKSADEEHGNVYAFNLIYSGSFLDEVEVDQSGNTRVGIGLGDEQFAYTLESGAEFTSPEAVMLFSAEGLGNMSRRMHRFVRKTLMPEEKHPNRPIVLNTWEACYFDINEEKLIAFANEGIKCGMDMLVMDDGWFGARNNDNAALGDWFENRDKFPDGLCAFVEKIKATGMRFGIWIEPEMINPDSELYRAHPDWCLAPKGRAPSLSRNQLVLDMCNPDVINYLKDSFKKVFKDVPIDYIKWDFNRHISEAGSAYLPADRQDEVWFRFYLGVYELYDWFVNEFPDAIIENCSGGGGRYDLAMMTFAPQIWCSDNTNAPDRNKIQYATSLAYPSAEMSCHVSDPGDDENTLARLKYKYDVAIGGMLGYELNILKTQKDVLDNIKIQTAFYRKVEDLIKLGDLYRLISPFENEFEMSAYYYADENADKILLSFLQNKADMECREYSLKLAAADESAVYTDELSGEKYSGKTLKQGIAVKAENHDEYSRIFYLVRNK